MSVGTWYMQNYMWNSLITKLSTKLTKGFKNYNMQINFHLLPYLQKMSLSFKSYLTLCENEAEYPPLISCSFTEKKDLVELVIKENKGASLSQNTTSQTGTQSSDKDDKSTGSGIRSSQPQVAKTNTAR